MLCSLLFGSPPGCEAACWAAAAAQTAGSTPGGGGINGGKPGTNPKGGIMGIGGAFGGVGAFAGAGAGAAFSFLTLEAGFLGMVACKWATVRRCKWGERGARREAGMALRWAGEFASRLPAPAGAGARKARGCAAGKLALRATQACASRREGSGLPLGGWRHGPKFH